MVLKKIAALCYVCLGLFLLLVVGGKLMLQMVAIFIGFMLIFKGLSLWGMTKVKSFIDLDYHS